jgi:drug/metabolite transporter (DMT)-like permease
MQNTLQHYQKWIILILLAITWGSSFILMQKGLQGGLKAEQVGALRIIFTSFFLVIIGFKYLKTIPVLQWKYIVIAGFLGNFLPIFLFAFAQTQITSSVTSTLNSFTPLNTLIIGSFFMGLSFNWKQKFGIICGVIGCLLLVYAGANANPSKNYYYAILVFIATWCYASNINLVKKHLSNVSPMAITVGNFTVYLVPALLILWFSGFNFHYLQEKNWVPLVSVAILGIVGTGIANVYFYKLIQMSSPLFASSVTYLIPIVATCIGIFDNENISLLQIIGTCIILFGVYISNRK